MGISLKVWLLHILLTVNHKLIVLELLSVDTISSSSILFFSNKILDGLKSQGRRLIADGQVEPLEQNAMDWFVQKLADQLSYDDFCNALRRGSGNIDQIIRARDGEVDTPEDLAASMAYLTLKCLAFSTTQRDGGDAFDTLIIVTARNLKNLFENHLVDFLKDSIQIPEGLVQELFERYDKDSFETFISLQPRWVPKEKHFVAAAINGLDALTALQAHNKPEGVERTHWGPIVLEEVVRTSEVLAIDLVNFILNERKEDDTFNVDTAIQKAVGRESVVTCLEIWKRLKDRDLENFMREISGYSGGSDE
jgi:hypothetical protein